MWIALGFVSALFLGLYDVCKKHAVQANAVLPVLWLTTVAGAAVMLPLLALSRAAPAALAGTLFFIEPLTAAGHAAVAVKASIISVSWVLAYFAMKHLPITLAAPIRSTGPLWTVLGALVIFQERPSPMQWVGLTIVLLSYYALALQGRRDGVVFHRNRWVLFMTAATLLTACSSLYDKYLLRRLALPPVTMQVWFEIDLALILGAVVATLWWPRRRRYTPLAWRWSIPAVGLLLVLADSVYFIALAEPEAMLALLTPLRRSGAMITFLVGGALFKEKNKRRKGFALAGILLGCLLIALSK